MNFRSKRKEVAKSGTSVNQTIENKILRLERGPAREDDQISSTSSTQGHNLLTVEIRVFEVSPIPRHMDSGVFRLRKAQTWYCLDVDFRKTRI